MTKQKLLNIISTEDASSDEGEIINWENEDENLEEGVLNDSTLVTRHESEVVDQALRAVDSLESMVAFLDDSLEAGGISQQTATCLRIGLESIYSQVNVSKQPELMTFSLESFDGGQNGLVNTKQLISDINISIENIFSDIYNGIVNFLNRIKSFFYTIIKQFKSLEGRILNIEENRGVLRNFDGKELPNVKIPYAGCYMQNGRIEINESFNKFTKLITEEFASRNWSQNTFLIVDLVNKLIDKVDKDTNEPVSEMELRDLIETTYKKIDKNPGSLWKIMKNKSKGFNAYEYEISDGLRIVKRVPTDGQLVVTEPFSVEKGRISKKVEMVTPTISEVEELIALLRKTGDKFTVTLDTFIEVINSIEATMKSLNKMKYFAVRIGTPAGPGIAGLVVLLAIVITRAAILKTKNETEKALQVFEKDTFKTLKELSEGMNATGWCFHFLTQEFLLGVIVYLENAIALAKRSN